MQTAAPAAQKRAKVRYSNRVKVLLCYLCCFLWPVGWLYAAFRLVYPYRLVGSAPLIAENLVAAFPFLGKRLNTAAMLAADPLTLTAQAWRTALQSRDEQWMTFLAAAFLLAWLLSLILQLCWRGRHSGPLMAAKNTAWAIRDYRLTALVIWGVNAAMAGAVWLLGAQFIQGKTAWDYLVYFAPYALNALAAQVCSRLAAPPVLSGRHGFFKRL